MLLVITVMYLWKKGIIQYADITRHYKVSHLIITYQWASQVITPYHKLSLGLTSHHALSQGINRPHKSSHLLTHLMHDLGENLGRLLFVSHRKSQNHSADRTHSSTINSTITFLRPHGAHVFNGYSDYRATEFLKSLIVSCECLVENENVNLCLQKEEVANAFLLKVSLRTSRRGEEIVK